MSARPMSDHPAPTVLAGTDAVGAAAGTTLGTSPTHGVRQSSDTEG